MKVQNKSKKKKLKGGAESINNNKNEKFSIKIKRVGYLLKETNGKINFWDTSGIHEYSPKGNEKAVYNQFYTETKAEAEKIKDDLLKEKPIIHNLDFTSSPVPGIPKSKSKGFMAIEKVIIYNDYGEYQYENDNDEIKEQIDAAKILIEKFKNENKDGKPHTGGSKKIKKKIKKNMKTNKK